MGLPWHEKPSSWVSVGCGTARDIEYVLGQLVACKTHLWLVDLSPELLSIANARVARLGLADRVTLALVDFTKRTDAPRHWTQRLNAWWFAHDGVWFDDAHPRALLDDEAFTTTWFHEAESRVPYTPLIATHYLYSGKKRE